MCHLGRYRLTDPIGTLSNLLTLSRSICGTAQSATPPASTRKAVRRPGGSAVFHLVLESSGDGDAERNKVTNGV